MPISSVEADGRLIWSVFKAKACPALDAVWIPVRVKKTRQIKNLESRFDSIEAEKALDQFLVVAAVAGRSPRRRCGRPEQFAPVLDVGDGNAEPFDGADDLAVEIAIAIHVGRRDEKLGLLPGRLEVPV